MQQELHQSIDGSIQVICYYFISCNGPSLVARWWKEGIVLLLPLIGLIPFFTNMFLIQMKTTQGYLQFKILAPYCLPITFSELSYFDEPCPVSSSDSKLFPSNCCRVAIIKSLFVSLVVIWLEKHNFKEMYLKHATYNTLLVLSNGGGAYYDELMMRKKDQWTQ